MFSFYVHSFADIVASILQCSLNTTSLPYAWKEAVVTPIDKGGPRDEIGNYRPIGITSIICKCLEHIISSCVWTHINSYDLLSNREHDFRKGYTCSTTQLLHVIQNATEHLDKKLPSHIVSFAFAKAFDKVLHNLLISKLHSY